MDSTSRIGRHVDDKDITFQYGVTFGVFDGGNVLSWGSSGTVTELNVSNKIIKLDGRLMHSVTPIERGVRYSLYFYKSYDPVISDSTTIFETAMVVKL